MANAKKGLRLIPKVEEKPEEKVERRGCEELIATLKKRLYSSGVAGRWIDRVHNDGDLELVVHMDGRSFRVAVRGPL